MSEKIFLCNISRKIGNQQCPAVLSPIQIRRSHMPKGNQIMYNLNYLNPNSNLSKRKFQSQQKTQHGENKTNTVKQRNLQPAIKSCNTYRIITPSKLSHPPIPPYVGEETKAQISNWAQFSTNQKQNLEAEAPSSTPKLHHLTFKHSSSNQFPTKLQKPN